MSRFRNKLCVMPIMNAIGHTSDLHRFHAFFSAQLPEPGDGCIVLAAMGLPTGRNLEC